MILFYIIGYCIDTTECRTLASALTHLGKDICKDDYLKYTCNHTCNICTGKMLSNLFSYEIRPGRRIILYRCNIPNLVRSTLVSILNFFSICKLQKTERQKVTGRSQQVTTSPFRATLNDAFRETQTLKASDKRRLSITSQAQASHTKPPQPLCLIDRTSLLYSYGVSGKVIFITVFLSEIHVSIHVVHLKCRP